MFISGRGSRIAMSRRGYERAAPRRIDISHDNSGRCYRSSHIHDMKTKLREMARDVPHCMGCGLGNPNGDLICLAHSNELADGRGAYHKSNDLYGAYLCAECHQMVDIGHGMTKEEKHSYHKKAWLLTMRWWIDNGKIKPA